METDLKKILLAGVGAAANTVEKSKEIVDQLAKKGQITLEQAKELNDELMHNIKEAVNKKVSVTVVDKANVLSQVESMTSDELNELKNKIREVESR